jgi:hypothetical protein
MLNFCIPNRHNIMSSASSRALWAWRGMVAQFGSLRWVASRAAAVYVPQVFLFAVEKMITNKRTADNPHIQKTSITGRHRHRVVLLVGIPYGNIQNIIRVLFDIHEVDVVDLRRWIRRFLFFFSRNQLIKAKEE